jgi:NADP-dependent 3-hydroxy acid dehydrogenase YdfG
MKIILITGASKGIGKATAIMLASRGHLVIAGSRSKPTWCNGMDNIEGVVLDVRDYASVQKVIEGIITKHGRLDVLVNNAGLGYFDPLIKGQIEHWKNTIDTNVTGLLNCLHIALPHLIAAKGHVVNLGSVAAHQVFKDSGVYCASKWAVLAISESIRLELEGKVRITTISPGAVNTEFIDNTVNDELLADFKPYFASSMHPETVAAQITFAIETPRETVISEIIVRPSRMSE